jgi:hypothetical protein
MRAEILAVLAIVALGTSGAMAQTTGESPADPSLKQEAPAADPSQPAQPKARMPMRREQPMVPDTTAPSSEGAGAGTSGADQPNATEPAKKGDKQY